MACITEVDCLAVLCPPYPSAPLHWACSPEAIGDRPTATATACRLEQSGMGSPGYVSQFIHFGGHYQPRWYATPCSPTRRLTWFHAASQRDNPDAMRKYRLIAKKGEGTFSEVLKAQNIKSGSFVAIKCMRNVRGGPCRPAAQPAFPTAPHPHFLLPAAEIQEH